MTRLTLTVALGALLLSPTAEAGAYTGHLDSSRVSRFHRICTYRTVRGDYAMTVRSSRFCPRTVRVDL